MLTKRILYLRGLGTAMVTPFTDDTSKSVDYDRLRTLIRRQIEGKADFLVALGTSAETPTLTEEEQDRVIRTFVEENQDRLPLVVGVSSNSTLKVINRLTTMDLTGIDAALVVCPFYNKPSQEGLYRHFRTIAEASPIPIIIYNVPSRTGVNMLPETTIRLANDCPAIIGIKEASGIVGQIDLVRHRAPEDFFVLSGDDTITFPLMTMGIDGVISVIGNAYPATFAEMVHLLAEGKDKEALHTHRLLKETFRLLFVDGNPSGAKALLSLMGLAPNVLRLPLVPVSEKTLAALKSEYTSVKGDPAFRD
ncbi:4-hydroxy-tetrahydrodipicolinate synthase [uncultured Porphyromonas sp.]|uniref:4-hydroxy-tetrahydrodipicolinate synthase n=1 Tax=uncultured Porphyromonas sp. TaxID=159274 RepID=UPI002602D9E2|nr:4-hydroxy-tetrahydrodipicolinate synthase [uncultured Porphyromonas sp.]